MLLKRSACPTCGRRLMKPTQGGSGLAPGDRSARRRASPAGGGGAAGASVAGDHNCRNGVVRGRRSRRNSLCPRPNAANGWVKVRTLEAIRSGLAAAPPAARVLCGDLNTPRRELPSGEVISFARDSKGRLRPERGAEWDEAERGVVPDLREIGYVDAFRALHGYERREPSWTWRRIAGHRGGWRLDHRFGRPRPCTTTPGAMRALATTQRSRWTWRPTLVNRQRCVGSDGVTRVELP